MIVIDNKSRKPIYEQIIDSVKTLIITGAYQRDDQLPPVRQLAMDLAINPNTIQKAYAELERQGIIYSMKGRGSYVGSSLTELQEMQKAHVFAKFDQAGRELKQLQVPEQELVQRVQHLYQLEQEEPQ